MIFCRFSTENQKDDSNANQERRCAEYLKQKGIPLDSFIVIQEEAISGTLDDRPGFRLVQLLMKSKRLNILATTEQSRVSRGNNIMGLIQNVLYQGGRFIAIADGIDTNQAGWQVLVANPSARSLAG